MYDAGPGSRTEQTFKGQVPIRFPGFSRIRVPFCLLGVGEGLVLGFLLNVNSREESLGYLTLVVFYQLLTLLNSGLSFLVLDGEGFDLFGGAPVNARVPLGLPEVFLCLLELFFELPQLGRIHRPYVVITEIRSGLLTYL